MKKTDRLSIISGVFCASLIISNILAFKTFTVLGITLPAAVIIFPVVYITNDVLTEVYGFPKARSVIFTGFAMNLVAVLSYQLAVFLPASNSFTGQQAFSQVLGNSWRVLIASFLAYICGSLLNAKIMDRMKNGKSLMLRCVLSTLFGESADAVIFITVSFLGTIPASVLCIMILSQALFKTVYEIIVFPITKIVIKKIKA